MVDCFIALAFDREKMNFLHNIAIELHLVCDGPKIARDFFEVTDKKNHEFLEGWGIIRKCRKCGAVFSNPDELAEVEFWPIS